MSDIHIYDIIKDGEVIESQLDAAGSPDAVRRVFLRQIHTDASNFQNREREYSEESVRRIVKAAEKSIDTATMKAFFAMLDPILLWLSPDGRLYVLSGHSRTEAFRRMYKKGARDFIAIPAKILENISLEQAKDIARNSNTLSTKESDIERAAYYRERRTIGASSRQTEEEAKEREGKNWKRIVSLSYLNPKGFLIDSIKNVEGADPKTAQTVNVVAEWVGEARRQFLLLTNSHEEELAKWLIYKGGYGTKPGQLSNKSKFLERVRSAVERNTDFGVFHTEKPLNMTNSVYKNVGEQEFDRIAAELKDTMDEQERILVKKQSEFWRGAKEGKISKARAEELIRPYAQAFAVAQGRYLDHLQRKGDFRKGGNTQAALFGLPMLTQADMDALGIVEGESLEGTAELYDRVNAKIVALIEKGGLFWRKPWGNAMPGSELWPVSYAGYPYSGINVLMLGAEQLEKGYDSNLWITLKKANEIGGSVRKGEKATEVVFWKQLIKDAKGNTLNITAKEARERQAKGEKLQFIPMLKNYFVFNLAQTTLHKPSDSPKPVAPPIWIAEAAWQGMADRPKVEETAKAEAYYRRDTDSINMPYRSLFSTLEGFYQTLFHEVTHATGAPHRLNRVKGKRFGDEQYGFEELVAELGAAYMMAWCGLAIDDSVLENSASYIEGWTQAIKEELKKDRTWLFRASSDASKAMEYILGPRLKNPEMLILEAEALEWEASHEALGNPAVSAAVKMMLADLAADQTGKLAKALAVRYQKWKKGGLTGHDVPQSIFPLVVGAINAKSASIIKRAQGAILLEYGDKNYGFVHIEEGHGQEIRNFGYDTVPDFVMDVCSQYNSVYKGRGNSIILAKINGKERIAVIRLTPKGDQQCEPDYWQVQTAFVARKGYLKDGDILWKGGLAP